MISRLLEYDLDIFSFEDKLLSLNKKKKKRTSFMIVCEHFYSLRADSPKRLHEKGRVNIRAFRIAICHIASVVAAVLLFKIIKMKIFDFSCVL